ncbi:MAG: hypothetical protein GXP36_09615 [Actinobacteria bacterium]|nr:hypothetical protein [Actinomycetota bacterium]
MIKRLTRDRQLPAGIIDAAMASLATFASGLTGVNLLSDTDRGVYGIFFTAFVFGAVLINQLIYVPSQVVAVGQDLPLRLSGLRRTMRLAVIPSVLTSSVALVAAALTRDLTTPSVLLALTVTVALVIPVSAMQDYVRRLLHIAEKSWRATAVSGFQLIGVAISIPILMASNVDRAWIPFGSLGIANVLSLGAGLILARAHHRHSQSASLSFRQLAASGKWLVVRAAVPAAAAFVAANVLTRLAGPAAYGYAEAARQVAQPVTVLAMGLGAVLGPRAIRAGIQTDSSGSQRTRRKYAYLITFASVSYVAVAGFDWVLNPMSRLVPSAYVLPWLVTATVLANAIAAMAVLLSNELIGAGKTKRLAGIAAVSSPMLLIVVATAATTGAYARPIGFIVEGLVVLLGTNWWLRHHYAMPPVEGPVPAHSAEIA